MQLNLLHLELPTEGGTIKRSTEYSRLVRVDVLGDDVFSLAKYGPDCRLNKRDSSIASEKNQGGEIFDLKIGGLEG